MRVFIQNEARSCQKHLHDEKTLRLQTTVMVSRAYPYPYGFILDTTSGDGDNLDCFVITEKALKTGTVVECEPLALLQQVEDGEEDHNILARLPEEWPQIDESVEATFREFISHVFDHVPGKRILVGRLLGKDAAERHIRACQDERA